jgi:hypothetical protein
MSRKIMVYLMFVSLAVLFLQCATIVGGSRYIAHVTVPDRPKAKISYNGNQMGFGDARFLVKRNTADKFKITVQEPGCEEQTFQYYTREFRGAAFVGTILGWTGVLVSNGTIIPIPWGVIVDLATGAVWKPNIMEPGVTKEDYKNFGYKINYTGCPTNGSNQ